MGAALPLPSQCGAALVLAHQFACQLVLALVQQPLNKIEIEHWAPPA
jgi:hypothetical protein